MSPFFFFRFMLVNLQNIDIWQDDELVLKNVNLSVDKGEFVYVIGKVGSGKSSLMKTFYADLPIKRKHERFKRWYWCDKIIYDDTERAKICGMDLLCLKRSQYPQLRRQLGIVFQDFKLLSHQTIEANLQFVLKSTGTKKKDRKQKIQEVIERVGLGDKLKKYPHELSGGEQQRVCIARALLNNPQIILADEPTGNLDHETSQYIVELLRSIAEQGTAVIMITHNQQLIDEYPATTYLCENQEFTKI